MINLDYLLFPTYLHYLHLLLLKVLHYCLILPPFNTVVRAYLLVSQEDLDVELLVGCTSSVDLHLVNVIHPEIYDWLHYEDHGFLQEVQPSILSFKTAFHARLPTLRLEVVPWHHQIYIGDCLQQVHYNTLQRPSIFWLHIPQVGAVLQILSLHICLHLPFLFS